MTAPPRITATVVKVLEVFLVDPSADQYGLDVMAATGCPSGTVYPILLRLWRAGWLDAEWEAIDPVAAGRPARRWYRLTSQGVVDARQALAVHRQKSAPSSARPTKPRVI